MDRLSIERQNLLHVAKLCIKELIDAAISLGRSMEEDGKLLRQFFVVLDHCLCHGLRTAARSPGSATLGQLFWRNTGADPWPVVELITGLHPEASDIVSTVKDIQELRTGLGRARAFLRLALMQKRLADYVRALVHERERLKIDEYYLPGALMLEEEGLVFAGLLSGLNVIDCNFHIKEQIPALEDALGVVNYSAYMKKSYEEDLLASERETAANNSQQDCGDTDKMNSLLDQKNYLEELNEAMKKTTENQTTKIFALEVDLTSSKERVVELQNKVLELQEQNNLLQAEKDSLVTEFERMKNVSAADIAAERETYQQSRSGLDNLAKEAQDRVKEETRLRLDVEKELQTQIAVKTEIEVALRLLEKDVHEKQDTIISLRRQAEEIKAINLDLYEKLKKHQEAAEQHKSLAERTDSKSREMQEIVSTLEERLRTMAGEKKAAEETAQQVGQSLAAKDATCAALETDLRIEKEWRGSLQTTLRQQEEEQSSLREQLDSIAAKDEEIKELRSERDNLHKRVQEQEQTLTEMASRLSTAELRHSDLVEQRAALDGAEWTDDRTACDCAQCQKPFSVARRKHHCRQCGKIFCAECSDNKMPLASHSKPVRVCDACHSLLLQRYSSRSQ